MLFLVRAIFWLTIVFASMPWPGDDRPRLPASAGLWPKVWESFGAALDEASAWGQKACAGAPAACFEAAAHASQAATQVSQSVAAGRPDGKAKTPLKSASAAR